MFLCYTLNIEFHVQRRFLEYKVSDLQYVIMFTISGFCGNYLRWAFASQYLKTCSLLPSFIRKKFVLLKMYEEKTEQEYYLQPLYGSFFERHQEFDRLIAVQRKSVKRIQKLFMLLDTVVGICFFAIYTYLRCRLTLWNVPNAEFHLLTFICSFNLCNGFILAWSAFSLAKSIKELTGKKPNRYLMVWHIINVLLDSLTFIAFVILKDRRNSLEKYKDDYDNHC